MILSIPLVRMSDQMHEGTIHRSIARPGDALRPGSPILEVRVDLSAAMAQDCPPVFYFRLISTERAYLRMLPVEEGMVIRAGDPLGVATTLADEDADGAAARPLRTMSVAIQVDPLGVRR